MLFIIQLFHDSAIIHYFSPFDYFGGLSPLQALLHTRNVSAEEAAMYYFNKLENEVPIS